MKSLNNNPMETLKNVDFLVRNAYFIAQFRFTDSDCIKLHRNV
jgi:hypothetical protein